jgi:hypothetical protein
MTSHVDEKPTPPLIGRRTIARGAAWSVPVVALAVAAPAAAATSTGCRARFGKLDWDLFAAGSNQLGKTLVTTLDDVTVRVTVSGDYADGNGTITSTRTGGLSKTMRFYDRENKSNTSQTITITFSKQVQNVSFSVLDVDSARSGGFFGSTDDYQDLVVVATPGWSGTKHRNVKGSGTSNDPYRARTKDSPVDGSDDDGNVDLVWPGKVTSVSFKYAQDGSVDGGPFIGISDIAFQTVC